LLVCNKVYDRVWLDELFSLIMLVNRL